MNTCSQPIAYPHSTDISFTTMTILLATALPVVIILAIAVTCAVGGIVCKKVALMKHGDEDQNKRSNVAKETEEAENAACLEISRNPAYIPLSEITNSQATFSVQL